MTSRVFDNGSGATFLQAANQPVLGAALTTMTPSKASSGTCFGFATSAKFNEFVARVDAIHGALLAIGAGKTA